MVDDYLSDREQEEALRVWWRDNWRWIIGGIALGVALLVGYFQWQDHRERTAEAASVEYEKVRVAAEQNNLEGAQTALATLVADHDSSPYAQQARLLTAKLQVEAGKYDEAAATLRAVVDNSKDEELATVAKLRLARVLLQQGKHDEAIALLEVEELGAFAASGREIRGDAQVAKGDESAARAEYAAALAALDDERFDRTLLEMKLQEVGGSAQEATADANATGATGEESKAADSTGQGQP